MVRLVFRPYTQIRRTICTSVSLRASTRVSPGFALFRHRSPSFGSQHVCSYSNLSQAIDRSIVPQPPEGRFLPQRDKHAFTFIPHQGFAPKYSHICQTPWSVFQDGSIKTISSASRLRSTSTPSTKLSSPQNFVLQGPRPSRKEYGRKRAVRSSAKPKVGLRIGLMPLNAAFSLEPS